MKLFDVAVQVALGYAPTLREVLIPRAVEKLAGGAERVCAAHVGGEQAASGSRQGTDENTLHGFSEFGINETGQRRPLGMMDEPPEVGSGLLG